MRTVQSNTTIITQTQGSVDLRTNLALHPENVETPQVLVLRLRGESSESVQTAEEAVLDAIVPYDQNAHLNYNTISAPASVLSTEESTIFLNLNRSLSENIVDNRLSRIPHDDDFSLRINQILENRDFQQILQ